MFLRRLRDAGILDQINWGRVGVSSEQMLAFEPDKYNRNDDAAVKKILTERVFSTFVEELESAISKNVTAFKNVLSSQEEDEQEKFLNECGSPELDYDKVKEITEERLRKTGMSIRYTGAQRTIPHVGPPQAPIDGRGEIEGGPPPGAIPEARGH
jgi:hypothetical protein